MSAGRAGAPTPEGLPAEQARAAPFLQLGTHWEPLLSQVGPQQGAVGPWAAGTLGEGWSVGRVSALPITGPPVSIGLVMDSGSGPGRVLSQVQ